MKWTYSIKNKLTASVLLFGVLLVCLLINLSERENSLRISKTVSTIYDDRLVVEGYIFRYSGYLHQISEIADDPEYSELDRKRRITALMPEIEALTGAYGKTRLTSSEALNFDRFIHICADIEQLSGAGDFSAVKRHANEAMQVLTTLSSIQISEAKSQMAIMKKLFSSGKLVSQFEMSILIIIALVIQALVLASKSLRVDNSPHLN